MGIGKITQGHRDRFGVEMRVKVTRSQVTTTIDPYLKAAFEATREAHEMDYNEVLEKGIKEILMKVDPVSFLEHEVARMDLERNEKVQDISRLKMMKELQPPQDEDIKKQEVLQKLREEQFLNDQESLTRQYLRRDLNWYRIIDIFEFKNEREAREWFRKRIPKIDSKEVKIRP